MLDQIKQIRSKFDEIAKDRIALQFFEEDGPRRFNSDLQITPTSHFVVESDIIGRECEKQKLFSLLSSESQDAQIISVVTIVGTGGIGKTTLAQLIYNDQIIRRKFDKLGWICLSEDFNVQRLTREVIESITRTSCGLTNLSALQEYISEEIRGKRVFLVLDDVWNENRSHWELFRAPFKSASSVKILVTTRNESVAKIIQTLPTFNLCYMSEEKSWQMFQHYAFGEVIHNTSSNLEEIGKQIMKKCGMLPLAIKSIASLLRHERKEESWREILENELWKSDACTDIFRPLQISYARLPTYLKPCFLYCSMFPRDYRYSAKELVQLWIYQGYVQTNEFENAEKIGWEYAKQLCQRSFFEGRYEEKEFYFRLHDMVHDLARWNSGHGCYFLEGDIAPNFTKQLYHLYVDQWEEERAEPPPFPSRKFATLRTLIMSHWVKSLPSDFNFSEAQKLRALKLAPNVYLEPDFSFVNFKHLRYLSLYGKCFERLPECICSLYNLKNLTLKDCPHLKELPKNIANLVSLEELAIYASDLRVLPTSLCELKALRKLYLENCSKFEGFHPI
ncbi:Disease resistance protein (CC-NBS-LRR class) family [Rhynchospora pubera]|uniref:Disease resistance protein (CC-NBS-LRR class) family n=1 Tax=Rhynchospora pubera TaxID=906938 RepID=A0AAV8GXL1_9POAL|nr:Disease resistance protein (CC-NBS-LRR class) family [Rhynchospora pubera]